MVPRGLLAARGSGFVRKWIDASVQRSPKYHKLSGNLDAERHSEYSSPVIFIYQTLGTATR